MHPFDRGWAAALPYATGVVELPEGVKLVAASPSSPEPKTPSRSARLQGTGDVRRRRWLRLAAAHQSRPVRATACARSSTRTSWQLGLRFFNRVYCRRNSMKRSPPTRTRSPTSHPWPRRRRSASSTTTPCPRMRPRRRPEQGAHRRTHAGSGLQGGTPRPDRERPPRGLVRSVQPDRPRQGVSRARLA